MPDFLIKPDRDVDWYVLWSTNVDGPIMCGSKGFVGFDGSVGADRFARADATGSSAQVGDPPWYSWAEAAQEEYGGTLHVYDVCSPGILKRSDLRAFCRALEAGDEKAAEAFLMPFED